MKIGIIGVGRLGICVALLFENCGHDILASDSRESYIRDLNNKKIDTTEPEVQRYLENSTNIEFTTDNTRVIKECDIIYTFVATPSLEDGSYDVSAVWKVVDDIRSELPFEGKSLVIGCTTNPGDCDEIQEEVASLGMDVYYNPEFIAQGSIIKDLQTADMVLIGGNGHHVPVIEKMYEKIQLGYAIPSIHYMSTRSAEIVKIAINTYLTTKISYANVLGEVLIRSELSDEVDSVLEAIGKDSRIGSKYLKFGYGFGGPCFPRDNRAFAAYASKVGVEFNIGETTDNFNDEHAKFLVDYFVKRNTEKLPFYFDYITYKKGTDIITESQQLRLCEDLLELGYKVYVFEQKCVVDQIYDKIVSKHPGSIIFVYDEKHVTEDVFPVKL
tara:strand:- start:451 stop:1605 length:1155 start_codon:yes stop_codon:yes gene_type:complete